MLHSNSKWLSTGLLVGMFAMFGVMALMVEFERGVDAATKPKTHVVAIRNSEFSPANLTVKAGDTVVWRNYDVVPHTATGRAFDSGNLDKGQSWRFVARKKGTLSYICTYHPSMKGRVIVK